VKMQDAVKIMEAKTPGFMVAFEHVGDGFLTSDHFPDVHSGEEPIPTEEEAWRLAARFAAKTHKRCVNIYVIRREDFTPVPGYHALMIENRT
jgi:hypothetical protein